MTALNPMLTLVAALCVRCGSTAETVKVEREILGKPGAACCEPVAVCWFCGADASVDPLWLLGRRFCCRACAEDWAE